MLVFQVVDLALQRDERALELQFVVACVCVKGGHGRLILLIRESPGLIPPVGFASAAAAGPWGMRVGLSTHAGAGVQ